MTSRSVGFAQSSVANTVGGKTYGTRRAADVVSSAPADVWVLATTGALQTPTAVEKLPRLFTVHVDWHSTSTHSEGVVLWFAEISEQPAVAAATNEGEPRPVAHVPGQFEELYAAIAFTNQLKNNWDGYGAHVPNETARAAATAVLDCLFARAVEPARIVPTAEGGIGLSFSGKNRRYADIECFNSGEILAVTSDRISEPTVWAVDVEASLDETVERILTFIRA
jgi:hypothetical protein